MGQLAAQSAGWIGTIMIVAAYYAVTAKKADPRDRRVLVTNLAGAVGVGLSVYVQRAWPALALQLVWAAIAVIGLMNVRRTP